MSKRAKKDKKKKSKARPARKKRSLSGRKKADVLEAGGEMAKETHPVPAEEASMPQQSVQADQPVQLRADVLIVEEEKNHPKGEIPVARLIQILGRMPHEYERIGSVVIRKCFLRQFWKIERQ